MNAKVKSLTAIFQSEGFKKYFSNTSWLLVERMLRMGIAFFVGAYVAKTLGPEAFGQLSAAVAFVGLFATFNEMGIDNILVRDLVREPHKRRTLMGSAFGLRMIGSFIMVILVVTLVGINTKFVFINNFDRLTAIMAIIIVSGQLFRPFSVIDYYYQAKVESKFVVRIQMIQVFINASLRLALALSSAPLIYFAVTNGLEAVIIAVGLVYTYHSARHSIFNWKFKPGTAARMLKEAWPLIIYGLTIHIQNRIDSMMILDEIGKAENGQYSVAITMVSAIEIIPGVIASSFAPAITQAKILGEEIYKKRRLNYYRFMTIVFFITCVPTFFLAEFIVVTFFGPEYRPAGILLSLSCVRLFFTAMGLAKYAYITNESLFKHVLFASIVGTVVNIVMNKLLIPDFAARGAIIATIISLLVNIFLIDFFFPKTRENAWLMIKGVATFFRLTNLKQLRDL